MGPFKGTFLKFLREQLPKKEIITKYSNNLKIENNRGGPPDEGGLYFLDDPP